MTARSTFPLLAKEDYDEFIYLSLFIPSSLLPIWAFVQNFFVVVVNPKQKVLTLWSGALECEITLLMANCCQLLERDHELPAVAW